MLEGEVDGCFQIADLRAAVIAGAFQFDAIDGALLREGFERVRETQFALDACSVERTEFVEYVRRDDVFADGNKVRWGFFGLRFLDELRDLEDVAFYRLHGRDAVGAHLVFRDTLEGDD